MTVESQNKKNKSKNLFFTIKFFNLFPVNQKNRILNIFFLFLYFFHPYIPFFPWTFHYYVIRLFKCKIILIQFPHFRIMYTNGSKIKKKKEKKNFLLCFSKISIFYHSIWSEVFVENFIFNWICHKQKRKVYSFGIIINCAL